MNKICLVCKNKNSNSHSNQLAIIKGFLLRENIPTSRVELNKMEGKLSAYTFYKHQKCKFGMCCNELQRNNLSFKKDAEVVRLMVAYYILKTEKPKINELLKLTAGYFPCAYKEIERLYHTK